MTERTGNRIALGSLVFAVLVQAGVILWGAARQSAAVDTLSQVALELRVALVEVTNQVNNLNARVMVVEDRLGRPIYRQEPDASRVAPAVPPAPSAGAPR